MALAAAGASAKEQVPFLHQPGTPQRGVADGLPQQVRFPR